MYPPLDVYRTWAPKRDTTHERQACHPIDVLISAVEEPKAFSNVLRRWLRTNAERGMARIASTNRSLTRSFTRLTASSASPMPSTSCPHPLAIRGDKVGKTYPAERYVA